MTDFNADLLIEALKKTDSDVRELRSEIHDLRDDIKDLNAFKWKVYGVATVISILITAIGTIIN